MPSEIVISSGSGEASETLRRAHTQREASRFFSASRASSAMTAGVRSMHSLPAGASYSPAHDALSNHSVLSYRLRFTSSAQADAFHHVLAFVGAMPPPTSLPSHPHHIAAAAGSLPPGGEVHIARDVSSSMTSAYASEDDCVAADRLLAYVIVSTPALAQVILCEGRGVDVGADPNASQPSVGAFDDLLASPPLARLVRCHPTMFAECRAKARWCLAQQLLCEGCSNSVAVMAASDAMTAPYAQHQSPTSGNSRGSLSAASSAIRSSRAFSVIARANTTPGDDVKYGVLPSSAWWALARDLDMAARVLAPAGSVPRSLMVPQHVTRMPGASKSSPATECLLLFPFAGVASVLKRADMAREVLTMAQTVALASAVHSPLSGALAAADAFLLWKAQCPAICAMLRRGVNASPESHTGMLWRHFTSLYATPAAAEGAFLDYLLFRSLLSPLLEHRKLDLCKGQCAVRSLVRVRDAEGPQLALDRARDLRMAARAKLAGTSRAGSPPTNDGGVAVGCAPSLDVPALEDYGRRFAQALAQDALSTGQQPFAAFLRLLRLPRVVTEASTPMDSPRHSVTTRHSPSGDARLVAKGSATGPMATVPMQFHEQFHCATALLCCYWGLEESLELGVLGTAAYDPEGTNLFGPAASTSRPPQAPSIVPNSQLASLAASPERVHPRRAAPNAPNPTNGGPVPLAAAVHADPHAIVETESEIDIDDAPPADALMDYQGSPSPRRSTAAASPTGAQRHLPPRQYQSLIFPPKTPASVGSLYANVIMAVTLLSSSRTRAPPLPFDLEAFVGRVLADTTAAGGLQDTMRWVADCVVGHASFTDDEGAPLATSTTALPVLEALLQPPADASPDVDRAVDALTTLVIASRRGTAPSMTSRLSFATTQTLFQWQFQAFVQHPTPVAAAALLHMLVAEGELMTSVLVNAAPILGVLHQRPVAGAITAAQFLGTAASPASSLLPLGDAVLLAACRALHFGLLEHTAGAPLAQSHYATAPTWPLYAQLCLAAVRLGVQRNTYLRANRPLPGSPGPVHGQASVTPALQRDAQRALGGVFLSVCRAYAGDSDQAPCEGLAAMEPAVDLPLLAEEEDDVAATTARAEAMEALHRHRHRSPLASSARTLMRAVEEALRDGANPHATGKGRDAATVGPSECPELLRVIVGSATTRGSVFGQSLIALVQARDGADWINGDVLETLVVACAVVEGHVPSSPVAAARRPRTDSGPVSKRIPSLATPTSAAAAPATPTTAPADAATPSHTASIVVANGGGCANSGDLPALRLSTLSTSSASHTRGAADSAAWFSRPTAITPVNLSSVPTAGPCLFGKLPSAGPLQPIFAPRQADRAPSTSRLWPLEAGMPATHVSWVLAHTAAVLTADYGSIVCGARTTPAAMGPLVHFGLLGPRL